MEPDNPILPEGLCEAVPPECTKDHGEVVRLAHHWVPGTRVSGVLLYIWYPVSLVYLIRGYRGRKINKKYFRYKRLFMPENKFVYFF